MTLAITRDISPRFNECEITHVERTPIDLDVARAQHHTYVQALRELGCDLVELPPEADLPDSVFVEDTAFILPELAVITRPGADSRKPEIDSIIRVLAPRTNYVQLQAPATLDGGDVLVLGHKIHIGLSTRSNQEAVDLLGHVGLDGDCAAAKALHRGHGFSGRVDRGDIVDHHVRPGLRQSLGAGAANAA